MLFGHYWWREDTAEQFGELATCLDYSVAAGGKLAAYRWDDGDTRLEREPARPRLTVTSAVAGRAGGGLAARALDG